MSAPLAPHPDRLFSPDPAQRRIARELYAAVAEAPILSPHGHVDAAVLADDAPFPDPATLLITPDHYVTRMLHANGVPFDRLGLGPDPAPPREVWRAFCEGWHLFLGTPMRYWFETEFADVFGLDEQPSAETADALYDRIAEALAAPEFRPRALFERFRIEVLATTDDPAADLAAHARLRADPSFRGRVLPTFRADRYMHPEEPGWAERVARLGAVAGVDTATHAGLLAALRIRRAAFAAAGGTATDTGVVDAGSAPLPAAERERIHAAALGSSARRASVSAAPVSAAPVSAAPVSPEDAVAYRRDLLYRLAEMSAEDGLVMQLHAGVLRNTHAPTLARYGPDTGHDLPAVGAYTVPLAPILTDFGTAERFRLVLFTTDESLFSREIAPLAGFYPAVYAGAPWWFLDSPDGIARYRSAITDSAGVWKTSGFIDDTRAFCSIPARHDMSRRVDADWLAGLVVRHRLSLDDASTVSRALVDTIPRTTFRL